MPHGGRAVDNPFSISFAGTQAKSILRKMRGVRNVISCDCMTSPVATAWHHRHYHREVMTSSPGAGITELWTGTPRYRRHNLKPFVSPLGARSSIAATRWYISAWLACSTFARFFSAGAGDIAAPASAKCENASHFVQLETKLTPPNEKGLIIQSHRATCRLRMYRGNIVELFLTFASNIITTLVDFYSTL